MHARERTKIQLVTFLPQTRQRPVRDLQQSERDIRD